MGLSVHTDEDGGGDNPLLEVVELRLEEEHEFGVLLVDLLRLLRLGLLGGEAHVHLTDWSSQHC